MLAIYCRTSKNKIEGTDFSIDTQQKSGIQLAHELGVNYKVYVDEGKSGTLDLADRESFAFMLRDIKKGKISAIYCIDQSRIERNTDVWRLFVGECINNQVKYYPNGSELDLKDPDSMLFANLLSLVNSYYAALTSKKVKLANAEKVRKGKTHGMKPYGFKRDEQNNYVIFEDEAQHVRRMFELSLSGLGSYTIANIFNAEKIPTKFNQFKGEITRKDAFTSKKIKFDKSKVMWRGNVIYDMLINPIYKGVRIWNRDNIEERIETDLGVAIVSPELWDKVNENLSKNKKNVGKKADYHYLLNGLIICGHCGNEVIGKKRMKGNDNAYKCKGKRPPHKDCTESRGLSLPKFENFIIQHLFESKELKQLLIDAPKNSTEAIELADKINTLNDELVSIERSLKRLSKLIKDPDLAEDENFIQDYKNQKTRQKSISDQIAHLKLKKVEVEDENRNERTKSLLQQYTSDISFEEIKRLVHSLIESITLEHHKEEKRGFYGISIKYRYYDEVSVFTTNWDAKKWNWQNYYRSQANNQEQLEEDMSVIEGLFELYNVENKDTDKLISLIQQDDILEDETKAELIETLSGEFKGIAQTVLMNEVIELDTSDLVLFD